MGEAEFFGQLKALVRTLRNHEEDYRRQSVLTDSQVQQLHHLEQMRLANLYARSVEFLLERGSAMLSQYDLQRFPEYDFSENVIHYSLGFVFRQLPDMGNMANWIDWDVLLALKKRGWQQGMLNGLGGKIDIELEKPIDSMVRECMEEAELIIPAHRWVPCGSITPLLNTVVEPYCVHCFAAFMHEEEWQDKFSDNREIDLERQTVKGYGVPMAMGEYQTKLLPNCSLLILGAIHALLNNQANVDEQASKPQVHIVYTMDQ